METTLFDIIEKYGHGKGEAVMWRSVKTISDAVEKNMDEKSRKALARKVYSDMAGGHYNEELAMEDVHCMYYIDEEGIRREAPYWSADQVSKIYDSVKSDISDYNKWDFFVTLNMVASDNANLYEEWFPNLPKEALDKKYVEAAISWLNDDDLDNKSKIWDYLNKLK